jgi:hypothetical protein
LKQQTGFFYRSRSKWFDEMVGLAGSRRSRRFSARLLNGGFNSTEEQRERQFDESVGRS